MSKVVPWSIKGVDFDAREAAKEAARRAGMTLGGWMNQVLAERVDEIGGNAAEFDAEERLEAVAVQLAQLSREREAATPVPQRRRGETAQNSSQTFGRQGFGQEARQEERREPLRQAYSLKEPQHPELSPVAPPSQEPTGRADALAQVDARLAEIEQKLRRASAPVDAKVLPDDKALLHGGSPDFSPRIDRPAAGLAQAPAGRGEQLARLEARMDALMDKLERQQARPAPEAASARDSQKTRLSGAIAEIAARQRDLDADSTGAAPRRQDGGEEPRETRLEARFDAKFETRFHELRERLERVAARAGAHPGDDKKIDQLQLGIDALTDRIENMRHEMAKGVETRQPGASSAEIEALSQQVAAMRSALENVAPRSHLAALESAMRDLANRIDASRDDGVREAVLAPIENLAGDVRRAVAEMAHGAQLETLTRQLRDVGAKIENLRETGGADRASFLKACAQSDEIRAMLAAATARMAPIARIEQQVASLAEGLQQISRQSAESGAREAGWAQSAEGWRGIETRLDDLASRLDRVVQPETPRVDDSRFDDLSRRLDFMHQALAERIDGAQHEAAPPAKSTLEPLLRALTEKLDHALQPQAETAALEALERQVAQVSLRLERGGEGQSNVDLQSAIDNLAHRFEQTHEAAREAARDVADMAARQAARQVLQEALAKLPVARGEAIEQDIADMRDQRDQSDRRTQQTLSAVHETLEKVVDRLAMLEEDVGETRAAQSERDIADLRQHPLPDNFDLARLLRATGAEQPAKRLDNPLEKPAEDDHEIASTPPSQNSYIDAARRALAARSAAEAAEKVKADRDRLAAALAETAEAEPGAFARPAVGEASRRAKASARRRLPAVLSMAGLVLALGAYQAWRTFDAAPSGVVQSAAAPQDEAPAKLVAAAPTEPKAVSASPSPAAIPAPVAPPVAPPSSAGASALPSLVGPTAGLGQGAMVDPLAVGSIGRATPFGAANPAFNIKDLADKGDAAAQYEMGARYAEGRAVARDPAAAVGWFEKAAAQGLAQAQYRLGAIYEKGLGAPHDMAKARDFYAKAAEQGNVRAMHNLAVLEAEGIDGRPDYANAAQWFRRAADYGVRDSQFNLAILYARGMGVTQSLPLSYVWFAIAAQQGDADAAKKRDEVAGRLDADTLDKAKKQASDFRARTPSPQVNEPPVLAPGPAAAIEFRRAGAKI